MKVKVNMELKFIVSLIFAILVAIFAIQNAGSVDVKFFFSEFRISQAVVILASTIIGAIIVVLLGLIKQIKQNLKIKHLTKEIDSLKSENSLLQNRIEELNIVNNQEEVLSNEETIIFEETEEDIIEEI